MTEILSILIYRESQ